MTKSSYYTYVVEQKGNSNSNIAAYATLVADEYDKWYNNSITLQTFIDNTPNIDSGVWPETINYIRNQLIVQDSA